MSARPRRRAALEEERSYLLASIDDLEREHLAGDVDDADYAQLRADYVARAANVQRALAAVPQAEARDGAGSGAPSGGSAWQRARRRLGRRRVRRTLGAVAALCVLAALGLTAVGLAHVRLPGQSLSGTVSLSTSAQVTEELSQASTLADEGQPAQAVAVYNSVLSLVPDQAQALTYRGWLERLSGLDAHSARAVRSGDASIETAVGVAPGYADARGLFAIALAEDDHDTADSLTQFRAFLADRPSAALLAAIGPRAVAVFASAKVSLPAALRPYAKTRARRAPS